MKKKVLFWTLGVIGVLLVGVGIYVYNIYSDVSKTLDEVHQPLKRDASTKRVDVKDTPPISILLMGSDPRGSEQGRSDSLMLITLNPNKESMKILSIPRDTYTEIIGRGTKDKINHAYAFGGIDMSVNTIENFLNVPIDYYIEVNMEGFKDIVDAVDGVDVNNDLDFTSRGTHFAKGPIHLDGEAALKYARMRYEDPRGDFGRQMRQRQVIKAVIKKGANAQTLASYGSILEAVQKNVKTNLTEDDIFKIQQNYKDVRNDTEEIQIEGKGQMINNIWYYIVSDQTREDLSKKLREHLELSAQ